MQRNTLITLSDNKIGIDNNADNKADFYTASVLSATDYYAFGMSMKERSWQSESYRYGYQGSEKNEEMDETYTTEYRQVNSKIGRWFSIDPKATAHESPYVSMGNNPIAMNDTKGDTLRFAGRPEFVAKMQEWIVTLKMLSPTSNFIISTLENSTNVHTVFEKRGLEGENGSMERHISLAYRKGLFAFSAETNDKAVALFIDLLRGDGFGSVVSESYLKNKRNWKDTSVPPDGSEQNGVGCGSFILINGNARSPNPGSSPLIVYLHELFHAFKMDIGKTLSDVGSQEEINTVVMQNIVTYEINRILDKNNLNEQIEFLYRDGYTENSKQATESELNFYQEKSKYFRNYHKQKKDAKNVDLNF